MSNGRACFEQLLVLKYFILCFFALSGCRQPPELCDVKGALLINGKPASGVYLVFHPQPLMNDQSEPIETTSVRTSEDGSFFWQFTQPGDYRVTLFWPSVTKTSDETIEGPDRFQGKYANQNSPVTSVTIKAGENLILPIELNTKRS